MRPWLLGLTVTAALFTGCKQNDATTNVAGGTTGGPPAATAPAAPAAAGSSTTTIDPEVTTGMQFVIQGVQATNCEANLIPHTACSKIKPVCYGEKPVDDADRANGISRHLYVVVKFMIKNEYSQGAWQEAHIGQEITKNNGLWTSQGDPTDDTADNDGCGMLEFSGWSAWMLQNEGPGVEPATQ